MHWLASLLFIFIFHPVPLVQGQSTEMTTEEVDTPVVYDGNCSELIELPPRGLACLQCTQPQAKSQAEALAEILYASCLKNIALNYLVDGSFGTDQSILYHHIDSLTRNGRHLYMHFYLSNGPAQRRWKKKEGSGFGSTTAPEKFRKLIQKDKKLRNSFRASVSRLVPLLRYARDRGVVISMTPMLEDNLDNASFNSMYKLLSASVPSDIPVTYGRSSCANCYKGNQSEVPEELFEESHNVETAQDIADGIVSNDGDDYGSSEEVATGRVGYSYPMTYLAAAQEEAANWNNIFILWSAKRQGLNVQPNGRWNYIPAAKRTYSIPTPSERDELIQFLRGELY